MTIETICSGCGQKLAVADENAGKQARCPACGQIYTVPQPGSSSPAEAADPGLAETTPGVSSEVGPGPGHDAGAESSQVDQFWMQTADGQQYGPVDRASLQRWFSEGRVGPGYQVRLGEDGAWQSAEAFRPVASAAASGNPYAESPSQAPSAAQPFYTYPKSDQGGLILAMGLLAFFLCPIFGIVAWVMGSNALKDIQAGRADPRSKGLVQVGYYLGIISVILNLICVGGYFVFIALAIVMEAM